MTEYIKPSEDDRVNYTFTKDERKAFLERLKALGIPTLEWVRTDRADKSIEEYSAEHLLDWIVTEIEALKKIVGTDK